MRRAALIRWLIPGLLCCGSSADDGRSPVPASSGPSVVPAVQAAAGAVSPSGALAVVDPSSGVIQINGRDGDLLVQVGASVRTAVGRTVSGARTTQPDTVRVYRWRVEAQEAGSWAATADVRTAASFWRIDLNHSADRSTLDISARIVHAQDTYLGEEALILRFSGAQAATMVDRAYRVGPAISGSVVDAWSPQRVHLETGGAHPLVVDGDAQSMVLEGSPDTALQVVFHADHHENHPLRLYKDCLNTYEGGSHPRSNRSAVPRQSGQEDHVSARLHLNGGPTVLPLRFPQGRRAAVVFTDHADQSTLSRLQALMYGKSGPTAHTDPAGGFVGHGLGMTKTVFHRSQARRPIQLSEPQYAEAVARLISAGIEVGPHSVGDGPDKREKTAESLPAFTAAGGSPVWIDHQPSTNCEALSSQGAEASSRYFLVDLLKTQGYRYAWAATDVREPSDGINLFDPSRPARRAPVLYRHAAIDPDGSRPIRLFSSLWRLYDPETFLEKYSEERLDRLQEDRGLHIAHTYLDAAGGPGTLRGKTLLQRTENGYRLLPKVDRWLQGLAKRQASGHLWVAGIVAVADHMVAMSGVDLVGQPGAVQVSAPGDVQGASFLVPGRRVHVSVDGEPLGEGSFRYEEDGTVFWLDLAANKRRIITWEAGVSGRSQ